MATRILFHTVLSCCLLAVASHDAGAQAFAFSEEDLHQVGGQVMDVFSQYELDPDVVSAAPSLEEWRAFWKDVDAALHAQSIEELAWMLPQVETAMGYLEQMPGSTPYLEWLKGRMDYFVVAGEAAGRARPATQPRSLRMPERPLLQGTDKPSLRVSASARDAATWRKRVKVRQPPERADEFIPVLKEIFRDRGVPHQLVWLAEVESSLDPSAISPSGAAGLFQFMPATAVRFGLQLEPSDERHDPEKSAQAAAEYLRFLHGEFQNWPLALAAYNAGEGAVGRLLAKRKARTFEEIAPYLPAETQMYVPKVLATVEIREGVDASRLPAPAVAMLDIAAR
jgi:membrane-bound lytic murein transglycosylase D